jgi:hypothetical protein
MRSIGQEEARRKKYMELKLGDGQACDSAADLTAVSE